MGLSKKLRFEVFKRDGFKCAYCGQTPPSVVLEVDHIEPRSNGGEDDINNLITACFACNRGKSNVQLTSIPPRIEENIEALKEREEQIKAYRKFIKTIENRFNKDIEHINDIYYNQYKEWGFSEQFKKVSLKKFLTSLPLHEVDDSLRTAISRFPADENKVIKYFYGICWNKIKSATDPTRTLCQELKRYWERQPRGSGYLPDKYIRYWVNNYNPDIIKKAMDDARGIWNNLRDILGEA